MCGNGIYNKEGKPFVLGYADFESNQFTQQYVALPEKLTAVYSVCEEPGQMNEQFLTLINALASDSPLNGHTRQILTLAISDGVWLRCF